MSSSDIEVLLMVRARSMTALAESGKKWADGQVAVVTSINKIVTFSAASGEWHLAKGGN